MFTRSTSISSDVEIVRAFAWNPRCATIMFVNSWAMSTLDISSVPGLIDPDVAGRARPADHRLAGVRRRHPAVPALPHQSARILEAGQRHLRQRAAGSVGEHTGHHSVDVHGHRFERAHGVAVLLHDRRRGRACEPGDPVDRSERSRIEIDGDGSVRSRRRIDLQRTSVVGAEALQGAVAVEGHDPVPPPVTRPASLVASHVQRLGVSLSLVNSKVSWCACPSESKTWIDAWWVTSVAACV